MENTEDITIDVFRPLRESMGPRTAVIAELLETNKSFNGLRENREFGAILKRFRQYEQYWIPRRSAQRSE